MKLTGKRVKRSDNLLRLNSCNQSKYGGCRMLSDMTDIYEGLAAIVFFPRIVFFFDNSKPLYYISNNVTSETIRGIKLGGGSSNQTDWFENFAKLASSCATMLRSLGSWTNSIFTNSVDK